MAKKKNKPEISLRNTIELANKTLKVKEPTREEKKAIDDKFGEKRKTVPNDATRLGKGPVTERRAAEIVAEKTLPQSLRDSSLRDGAFGGATIVKRTGEVWREQKKEPASAYSGMNYRQMTDDIHNTYGGELRRGSIGQLEYYVGRGKYDRERIEKADYDELQEMLEEKRNEHNYLFSLASNQNENRLTSDGQNYRTVALQRAEKVKVLGDEIRARIARLEEDGRIKKEYDDTFYEFGKEALNGDSEYKPTESGMTDYDLINNLNKRENGKRNPLGHLTKGELKIYNSLYNESPQNPEKAEEFLKSIEGTLNKRLSDYETKEAYEYGLEHPYIGGAKSTAKNVAFGAVAAVDNLIEGITGDVDTYDATSRVLREGQAYRQGGSEYMNQKHGKWASFAYNTGLSMIENAINRAIFKGAGKAASKLAGTNMVTNNASKLIAANMASNAAANSMINIADRGGNDFQILAGGIASGAAEYLFEKYSVEKLFEIGSTKGFLNKLKTGAIQAGVEESEEIFTEAANILSDAAIMQENSESNLRLREYVMQGMSYDEASKQVFRDNVKQIAESGLSGMISGGVMGGGAIIANDISRAGYLRREGEALIKNPDKLGRILQYGIDNGNADAKYFSEIMREGQSISEKEAGDVLESVLSESLEKDGGIMNIIRAMEAIQGESSYLGTKEALDTAKAVMHMAEGKVTDVDRALIGRSEGAVTLLTAIEGNNKALGSIRKAAGEQLRSSASQMQNAKGIMQNGENGGGVKYRIGHTNKNNPVVMLEEDIFEGKTGKPHNIIANYIAENIGKHYKIFESGQSVYIGEDLPNEFTQSKYTTEYLRKRKKLKSAKDQSVQNLGEIIEIATDRKWEKSTKVKHQTDAKYGFYKYKSRVALPKYDSQHNVVGSHLYEIELVIRNDANGKKYLYDIQNITKIKEGDEQVSSTWSSKSDSKSSLPSNDRVPQNEESVNSNYMQDEEVYSDDQRVVIPEGGRVAKNIVLNEESLRVRREKAEDYKNIEILAHDLGMKVMYVKGLTDSNGDTLDGIITSKGIIINSEAKNISRFVATHEFSHRLKQISPEKWNAYQSYVIDKLKKEGRYYAEFERKAAAYQSRDEEVIDEEIACDYIGELFNNEAELSEFIRKDVKVATGVRNLWYNILDRLGLLDEKKKAQRLWASAYREAMNNKGKEYVGEKKKINPTFERAFDNWVNNLKRKSGITLKVGSTSEALISIGVKEQTIYWDTTKINDTLKKHPDISIETLKSIPELIENPMLIMEERNKKAAKNHGNNRIFMLGELYNENGVPIIAFLELEPDNGDGVYLNDIKIISTYAKVDETEPESLENTRSFVKNSHLLYLNPNKNRTNNWLARNRLQLPFLPTTYGPINKITYSDAFVNNNSMQDGKKKNDAERKQKQFEIIRQNNPAPNDYLTWVRSVEDVRNYREAWDYEEMFTPDFTEEMANKAIKRGEIKVYSSYPIGQGTFVTPSKMEAEGYSGNGKVYEKVVKLEDVAWITSLEGQYAKVDDRSYGSSKSISGTRISDVTSNSNFRKWFGESKIVDDNGAPKIMYRGDDNMDFTVFDRKKSKYSNLYGRGFYFTESESAARTYGKAYPFYLKIENPLTPGNNEITEKQLHRFLEAVAENEDDYDIWNYGTTDIDEIIGSLQGKGDFETIQDISATAIGDMVEAIELFNSVNGTNYDGIVTKTETVVFDSTQIKSATDNIGTFDGRNPDIRYSISGTRYSDIESEESTNSFDSPHEENNKGSGFIPSGAEPRRDVKVPKSVKKGTKVRQFARTAAEAETLSDETAEGVLENVEQGKFSYVPVSDKSVMDNAYATLVEKGIEWVEKKVNDAIGSHSLDKNTVAMAEVLMQRYSEEGDQERAQQLIIEFAAEGTRMGQSIQAISMLKKLDKNYEIAYIEKIVENLKEEIIEKNNKKKFGKKQPANIEVSEELKSKLMKAKTEEEREAIREEVYTEIARQLPSSWVDKWNAWRYMAMLGNARTHVRNVLGNAFFMPMIGAKNIAAKIIEPVVAKASGSKMERSKTFFVSKEYRRFAAEDAIRMKKELQGGGKHNPTNTIREKQTVFEFKPLEWTRIKIGDALETEDWLFLKKHYITALSNYLAANKIDLNNIDEKTLDRARRAAVKEAQRNTYRDASVVANALSRFSGQNAITTVLVEGLMPFKKTPVNVLKRGIEYSPAGLVKALTMDLYKVTKGDMTASQCIDRICCSLTGPGVIALGMLLRSLGLITGASDDDDEKEFDELTGVQNYSITVGEHNYTLDWLAPFSLPFFVGVEIQNLIEKGEGISFRNGIEVLSNITEPFFEMSMLQGLADTVGTIKKANSSEVAGKALWNVVTNYANQGVPTLFGQIARTVDGTQRRSYDDKNVDMPGDLQYFLQGIMKKLPRLSSKLEPYVDAWGRKVNSENMLAGAIQNMLSPGYYSDVNKSPMEKELKRLYEEVGEEDGMSIFPSAAVKKFKLSDGTEKNLTAKEYTKLQTVQGQNAYRMLTDITDSEEYKELDDYTKGKIVSKVYEVARASGKSAVADGKWGANTKWVREALELVESGEYAEAEKYIVEKGIEQVEESRYEDAKEKWKGDNFEVDYSNYSKAEVGTIENVESDAASYYVSIEKGIEYDKSDLRHIEVYDKLLSETMSIEEYAGARAYAKKTAAMADEKPNMKSKELQNYLDSTNYGKNVKAALFEAIGNKGWKNPYTGKKVGEWQY